MALQDLLNSFNQQRTEQVNALQNFGNRFKKQKPFTETPTPFMVNKIPETPTPFITPYVNNNLAGGTPTGVKNPQQVSPAKSTVGQAGKGYWSNTGWVEGQPDENYLKQAGTTLAGLGFNPSYVSVKIDDNIPGNSLEQTPSHSKLSEDNKGATERVIQSRFEKEQEKLLKMVSDMTMGIAKLKGDMAKEYANLEKNPEGVFGEGVLNTQLNRLSKDQALELSARTGQLNAMLDTLELYQGYRPQIIGTPKIDETTGEAFAYIQDPMTGEIAVQNMGKVMEPVAVDPYENLITLSEGQTVFNRKTGQPLYSNPKTYAPTNGGGGGFGELTLSSGMTGDLARMINVQSSFISSENQRRAYINAAYSYLERGDYNGLKYYMRNQAVNNVPAADQTGYRKNIEIMKGLDQLEKIVSKMEAKGVDSGVLQGSWQSLQNKLGAQGKPELVSLLYQAQQAMDLITRQRTGAALNESEQKFYKKMVPGIFKGANLNKQLISEFKNALQNHTDSYLGVYFSPEEIDTLNTAAAEPKPSLVELISELK